MTIRDTYNIIHDHRKEWDDIKTIEELKEFDTKYGLKLSEKRFFIDQDYKKPRAFGIYKDIETGNTVVYKNKGNGERAVRYNGSNEAYGVKEIKNKFIDELKNRMPGNSTSPANEGAINDKVFVITAIVVSILYCWFAIAKHVPIVLGIVLGAIVVISFTISLGLLITQTVDRFYRRENVILMFSSAAVGVVILLIIYLAIAGNRYYKAGDTLFFHLDKDWYYYESSSDTWLPGDWDYDTYGDYSDYETSEPNDVGSFYDTDYYDTWVDENYSSSGDSDSSSSWDSDWDSGGTDWDSDW